MPYTRCVWAVCLWQCNRVHAAQRARNSRGQVGFAVKLTLVAGSSSHASQQALSTGKSLAFAKNVVQQGGQAVADAPVVGDCSSEASFIRHQVSVEASRGQPIETGCRGAACGPGCWG